MKAFKISDQDLDEIKKVTAEAESDTSGEIASAIILQSDTYAFRELMVSLLGGVLFYLGAMLAYGHVESMVNMWFWDPRSWYASAFLGVSTILVVGVLYVLANIPGVDRLIVSADFLSLKVKRRAMVHFLESGVYNTRDRTGILIFVSLRERRVEIVADQGISGKVSQDTWDRILLQLTSRIRQGETGPGLVEAIRSCGDVLSHNLPRKSDDTNELPDGLVFLED